MMKLTPPQKQILEKLIYPEPFSRVQEETGMDYGSLRDELMQLINHGFVEVFEQGDNPNRILHLYDTDNLQLFAFRATKRGLAGIKNIRL